jgi:nucleotide-binding universal stress UspA family protein
VIAPAAQLISTLAAPGPAAMHLVRVLEQVDAASLSEEWVGPPSPVEHQIQEWALERSKANLTTLADRLRTDGSVPAHVTLTWSVVANPQFATYERDVAGAILRTAEAGEPVEGATAPTRCDLIAMATHGREGLSHLMLGSITERVLHSSTLPMLVVRPPTVPRNGSGA